MFTFLRHIFDRMYYYFFPLKKKEIEITRNWNPVEQTEKKPPSPQTIGKYRDLLQNFYKSDRTRPHQHRWGLDSAYNTY